MPQFSCLPSLSGEPNHASFIDAYGATICSLTLKEGQVSGSHDALLQGQSARSGFVHREQLIVQPQEQHAGPENPGPVRPDEVRNRQVRQEEIARQETRGAQGPCKGPEGQRRALEPDFEDARRRQSRKRCCH